MFNELSNRLLALLDPDTVLIGIGNEISGDDGFGPELAKRLKPFLGERAIDGGLAPENWTGPISKLGPKILVIADAVDFGGEPGDIGQALGVRVIGQVRQDAGGTHHSGRGCAIVGRHGRECVTPQGAMTSSSAGRSWRCRGHCGTGPHRHQEGRCGGY